MMTSNVCFKWSFDRSVEFAIEKRSSQRKTVQATNSVHQNFTFQIELVRLLSPQCLLFDLSAWSANDFCVFMRLSSNSDMQFTFNKGLSLQIIKIQGKHHNYNAHSNCSDLNIRSILQQFSRNFQWRKWNMVKKSQAKRKDAKNHTHIHVHTRFVCLNKDKAQIHNA